MFIKTATDVERKQIGEVVDRVFSNKSNRYPGDRVDLMMDLEATNEIMPLDFARLLSFPDGDFYHDIYGIYNYYDRGPNTMTQCFSPRCSKPSVKEVGHIEDVPRPRTADMIAQCLTKAPEGDDYHNRIILGAKALQEANRGHFRYCTQYGSGRCLWESGPCLEIKEGSVELPSERVTVYTNGELIEE
jgi:hypothetical protein